MKRNLRGCLLAVGLTAITLSVFAQTEFDSLSRRGYFGVGLEKASAGARVFTVSPGSTAAQSGIVVGDVIEAVDGKAAVSPEAVVAAIGLHRSGDVVRIDLLRKADHQHIEATLKAYPLEQMANATVHYGSVTVLPGVRLRTILSIPSASSNSRFPAVLLIQGGGCGSIDTPLSANMGQSGLMHAIGSHGFVTMRVEKSGVGDSQGMPCESIGFKEELAGYHAALKALQSHPTVDVQRVYLVGISLGGVFAPLLGAETKVAGISVYGTLPGPPSPYPGRSERFFQEIATADIAGAWAKVATRVQVLHGEYDTDNAVNRAAHELIAAVVNKSAAGSAQFHELPGLDHCWSRHASLAASKDRCGQGEVTNVLSDAILDFLRAER
jgi:dienelactone hydrolase